MGYKRSEDIPGETSTVDEADRRGWWRSWVMAAALLVMTLAAPLAVLAAWTNAMVTNTDRYVATVAPLADDPAVQSAVAARIATEVTSTISPPSLTDKGTTALAERGLPDKLADELRGTVADNVDQFIEKQALKMVQSETFARTWANANRLAHSQMVALLTGQKGGMLEAEGDAVRINIGAPVEKIKAQLVDAGMGLAEQVPTVDAQFTVFESPTISKAQDSLRILSTLAWALPATTLVSIAAAVATARRRRRMLVISTSMIAATMLALWILLAILRIIYLDAVPAAQLPRDAASATYDQLTQPMADSLRTVLATSLAVSGMAWIVGRFSLAARPQ